MYSDTHQGLFLEIIITKLRLSSKLQSYSGAKTSTQYPGVCTLSGAEMVTVTTN